MGVPVLILGESGSGKSTSLRNFDPNEVVIYNVAGKPLPFRSGTKMMKANNPSYGAILANLSKKKFKRYVIDDSQYLMCFELFDRSAEGGYAKFTEMAKHFFDLVQFVIRQMPDDVIVYFLHHVEMAGEKYKAKTVGRMLDEKLTVEGLFSIVLMTKNIDGKHFFITQSDGTDTVKTPMDMFSAAQIDNDLKIVDQTIRAYYGMTTGKED